MPEPTDRPWRKVCVEECAWILDVGSFRRSCLGPDEGDPVVFVVEWLPNGEPSFRRSTAKPTWLASRCPPDWHLRVQLDPQPWPIYGTRWFFRCSRCDRRCGVLYAPRAGSPLHCRLCHNLSYESAQRWNNVKRTGRHPGVLGRMLTEIEDGGDGTGALRRHLTGRR